MVEYRRTAVRAGLAPCDSTGMVTISAVPGQCPGRALTRSQADPVQIITGNARPMSCSGAVGSETRRPPVRD